jgi:putative tryptophan/tyrosine transport system substrate-binding protein
MRRRDFITLVGGGAAFLWPLAAKAQGKVPVIGYLHFAAPDYQPAAASFLKGLAEMGLIEGRDFSVAYRWADGHYDRLPALASELVGLKVDLIAAFGPPPAKAAKAATSTIPIVFEVGNDAVEAGLVKSLARPDGNATGLNILFTQLTAKRLELLCQLLPKAKNITLLINPKSPTAEPSIRNAEAGARSKGVQLSILNASNDDELETAFSEFGKMQSNGLIVAADPFFDTRRQQLPAAAARHRVPTIYFEPEFSAVGGLISYGSRLSSVYSHMGIYAGRILKGEKPADLPVEQPTKFELAINLKTARALGIETPPELLFTADEVIE